MATPARFFSDEMGKSVWELNDNNKKKRRGRGRKKLKDNKKVKLFSIIGNNINGLKAKTDSLQSVVNIFSPSVVCLQETKVKSKGIWNICLYVLLMLRLRTPEEVVEMDSMKAKVVFAIVQLAFTVGTVLPTYFLYSSYLLSVVYILIILTWGAWNGATYYIEVFAERYALKFDD